MNSTPRSCGGTEVFRHGDFQGDTVHNTLLTDQDILANELGVNPRTIGVPDLRGGTQRLDVRFIQFDNVVIELLQYRDADQPMGGPRAFAEPLQHMSPAFPRMMHICFHVRDDVDFNKFITDLEAESARRGMTQVRANRIIRVDTEAERRAAPQSANTNKVTVAPSDGWELIYCKGPEGEQLEFVKALGPVKQRFATTLAARQRALPVRGEGGHDAQDTLDPAGPGRLGGRGGAGRARRRAGSRRGPLRTRFRPAPTRSSPRCGPSPARRPSCARRPCRW